MKRLKRLLRSYRWWGILCLVILLLSLISTFVFKEFGVIGLVSVIGAVTGLVSLGWLIYEKVLWQPKINVTAELVHENDKLSKVRHIASNSGKPVEIITWGFVTSEGSTLCSWRAGVLPHRLRKGLPHIHEFDISTIVERLQKNNSVMKYAYVQDEKEHYHINEIPKEIIDALQDTDAA